MDIGSNLREARLSAKMTQEEISTRLFVTRQTVSRWEQNRTLPNIHVLLELSEIYQIPLDSLVSRNRIERGDVEMSDNMENNKRSLNFMALVGSAFFNIFLFSGIALTLIIVLGTLWLLIGVLITSPVILLIAILSKVQPFDWFNGIISFVLPFVGFPMVSNAKGLSVSLMNFFKRYYKFNVKMLYRY